MRLWRWWRRPRPLWDRFWMILLAFYLGAQAEAGALTGLTLALAILLALNLVLDMVNAALISALDRRRRRSHP